MVCGCFLSLFRVAMRYDEIYLILFHLKALIQPSCLACVISWLAFVVVVFMGHENGENNGQQRDDMSKA